MLPLRFFFDFVSPYAYIAWTQIHDLAQRHRRSVEPVPVLFAALLDANGQMGPAEIPNKRMYVMKDVLRIAHALGLPLSSPPAHPFNPLLALRVAGGPMSADQRRRLIDGLFAATWAGGSGVEDPAKVAELASAVGLDGVACVTTAATSQAKATLRAQTDAAVAAGVFGVPSILADGELFWGYDAFPHIERRLRGQDPIDAMAPALAAWRDLPASAHRRR
jgi:2-hydroxychromene-2-carboxylate isomerase